MTMLEPTSSDTSSVSILASKMSKVLKAKKLIDLHAKSLTTVSSCLPA